MFAVATAIFVSVATSAGAAEYYVDPSAGGAGDGSAGNPWGSLQDAIDAGDVAAGDTVWLMSGDHGALRIESARNADTITLAAAEGQEPRFTSVLVRNSSAWTLRGLHVVRESGDYLIEVSGDSEEVAVESCVLMSTLDASGWSAQDWINRASSGISADGTQITIRNNLLLNVGYGISVSADHSLVEGNLIENFSRDGLRGLGDYSVFQYNTVKNCYAVDDHHDDGFQSWSVGEGGVGTGEVVGVVLRGNTFINYEDPNQPHRGTLQGIGCFDGTFVDWVIENNVVMTDHWHGITLLGARNSTIINNTVVDLNEEEPGPPWISIDDHKDGTAPTGCVVRNNLTTALSNSGQVVEENNITFSMDETAAFFVGFDDFDLHLLETAAAVDTGTATGAPELDRDLIPRPQGDGIDVGAYEWHDGSVEPLPSDGGPPRVGSPGGTAESGGCAVQGQSTSGGWVVLLVLAALRRRQGRAAR
jgi:parallel beta-helix repeat protein